MYFILGMTGKIISAITEAGFRIGAAQMMVLEKANAEEFLEVYKGVVHEYNGMVAELTAGACIALEVLSDTQNTVQVFRELAGPADPVSFLFVTMSLWGCDVWDYV